MDFLLDTCGRRRYLLVMQLFVLNAAANCPLPKPGGTIILTNAALLMNHFPEGSNATLQCANGFVIESGSAVMYCTGGKWTEPDLKCKKMDCGPPKPQPNMSFNISEGTLFGAVIRVLCDKGFQISGASYKTCYPSGWNGRAKCEIVTCEQPATVANSITVWDHRDNLKYGEIIHFICKEGFTLVGSRSIMCSESGEYDSEPPECKDVTAEDRISPNTLIPTPATPAQVSTSTDSLTISTAHRDTSITTSATATVPPAAQGGGDSLTTEEEAATTRASSTTSSFRDKHDQGVNTYTDTGHTPVIVSVVCIALVAVILLVVLDRCYLKRKGSYDTREDLKPELLQFQNL